MRAGPGLGNIWPSQSDYFQATKGGGHGDYHMIVLAPWSIQESYDLTRLAFDLADRWRMTVMILSDGLLGQMMEGLEIDEEDKPPEPPAKPWALTGAKGRAPNIIQSLYMRRGEVEKHNLKLQRKYKKITTREQRSQAYLLEDARIVIVAYGSVARIAVAAVDSLRKKGKKVGLLRPVSLWPFPKKELQRLCKKRIKRFLVVEMSYGQMVEDVRLSAGKNADVRFYGRSGGGVPAQKQIEREALKIY